MSKWRRVAIEAVPCIKTEIEEARHPADMWLSLVQALQAAYKLEPRNEEVIQEIYRFVLWCLKDGSKEPVSYDVWIFMEYLFQSQEVVIEDLPNRLPAGYYSRWDANLEDWVSEKRAVLIRSKYSFAK